METSWNGMGAYAVRRIAHSLKNVAQIKEKVQYFKWIHKIMSFGYALSATAGEARKRLCCRATRLFSRH
jgi:hypothetical protein